MAKQVAGGKTYLVFIDHRFDRIVGENLRSAFPECALEPYAINNSGSRDTVLFKLEAEGDGEGMAKRIRGAALPFIDFVMSVDAVIEMGAALDYRKLEDALSRVLDGCKRPSFRIEVRKVGYVAYEAAKSIEVRLGRDLEERGYAANLRTPEVLLYAVLLDSSAAIGHSDAGVHEDRILDPFRQTDGKGGGRLNRAEFKIEEAVEFFGIDLSTRKRGLDIGAAPGGWARYLSRNGIRVVAVDNGLLDYGRLSEGKRILVLADDADALRIRKSISDAGLSGSVSVGNIEDRVAEADGYDIIHIKANIGQERVTELLRELGGFDLLTIDTNRSPSESASVANSMAGLLNPGAALVMTVKLKTRKFGEHVSTAETELSRNYVSLRLKKLPHNRRELTAYGIVENQSGKKASSL